VRFQTFAVGHKPGRSQSSAPLATSAFDPAQLAALLISTAAGTKEAEPEQANSQDVSVPKPVATTTIKRCPEGYEPVTRYNGQHACAKDFVPLNEPPDGFR
jgi:hypothetical protein